MRTSNTRVRALSDVRSSTSAHVWEQCTGVQTLLSEGVRQPTRLVDCCACSWSTHWVRKDGIAQIQSPTTDLVSRRHGQDALAPLWPDELITPGSELHVHRNQCGPQ